MKKLLPCLLVGILLISTVFSVTPAALADTEEAVEDTVGESPIVGDTAENAADTPEDEAQTVPDYREYSTAYEKVYPAQTYTLQGSKGTGKQCTVLSSFDGVAQAMRFESGTLSFSVTVEQTGYYQLSLFYQNLPGKGKNPEIAIRINGSTPFDKAAALEFNCLWKNDLSNEDFRTDSRGNDILPDQVEAFRWIRRDATDSEGMYVDPFWFHFEKGINTLELKNLGEPFVLGEVTLHPAEKAPAYAEARPELPSQNVTDYWQLLEGEKGDYKSSKTIIPTYNKGDPAVSPSDPAVIRRNTLGGGTSWQSPNEYVTWCFKVPEDGYYKIGIKYAQNQQRGLNTSRRIRLDGALVYDELREVQFHYTSVFRNLILNDGKEEMLFWLKAGITHELTLETTVGEISEDLRVLTEVLSNLNGMYRKIIMVTGADPDITRDYDLEAEIPELLSVFGAAANALGDEYQKFTRMSQKGGSEAEMLMEFAGKLHDFLEKPYTIAERLSSYRDSLSSLAAWLIAREQQPLEVDYVAVFSPDRTMPKAESSFSDKLVYEFRGFVASFTQDYNRIGSGSDEDGVEVWVSSGREQSLIVRELVDARFYTETGIPTTVKLVKSGLVQCVMAGVGPDVALSVDRTLPVNLALRHALVDLSQFKEYEAVTKRFSETAMEPYLFSGGTYAIPETQSFHMMFYRTDIFEELGIKPPNTWDDFYRVINIIQRNNMEIGLPYGVSSSTADAMSLFPTLLLQKGGSYYNDEKTASVLCSNEGYAAFTQWTDFYRQYSFSMVKDDYNRFRTGEMPLTIVPYVFYNQLRVAAPEIKGLWKMVQIPGTEKENGEVLRSEAAAGTGNVMFGGTRNRENAWRFIEWWTRAETQAAFGQKIETVLGAPGRYASANLEAVTMLPWTEDELVAIGEQRRWVVELPEIAGSYYMARNINNAFLAVVNRGENLRESLRYWDNETNQEILRKRRELGLEN